MRASCGMPLLGGSDDLFVMVSSSEPIMEHIPFLDVVA